MNKFRYGIIGVGRQGSSYLRLYEEGKIANSDIIAICDIREERLMFLRETYGDKFRYYLDYQEMMSAEDLDGIIVATEHFQHIPICKDVIAHGINVLCEKPLGVRLSDAAGLSELITQKKVNFGMMFNQRNIPEFKRIKEILEKRELGELKRFTWIITDWYRPQGYFDLDDWRCSWTGEGGGVLINQSVHNMDMMNWLFGIPQKVRADIGYGRFHNTLVDDEATVLFTYKNGAKGVFITSTGELPGSNYLDISFDRGRILCRKPGELIIDTNEMPESEYSHVAKVNPVTGKFKKMAYEEDVVSFERIGHGHSQTIERFADACRAQGEMAAGLPDGLACLKVMNAIYLSDWTKTEVSIDCDPEEYASGLRKLQEKEEAWKKSECV